MLEEKAISTVCAVSDLVAQPVNWLWPGRLALGKPALLEGDPGLGKSLVTLDLCARLSRGSPFPDGGNGPGCGCSLVVNAEDGAADTIRPRLLALDADLNRVFVMQRNREGLRFPAEVDVLEDALRRTAARLVVIDPLTAFLEGSVWTGDAGIRRALGPLIGLGERYQCTILLVRHLNKSGGRQAIYRGGGSIGLIGLCRSAWLVARDLGAPGRCVLAQVKNNLAARQPSLAYTVSEQTGEPPRLSWLGQSAWLADDLLARGTRGRTRLRACEFLRSFLQAGPRLVGDIWPEARRLGLSQRTLQRAKQDLQLRHITLVRSSRRETWWLLPGQQAPTVDGQEGMDDLEPWLAPLREAFPPENPLEENGESGP